MNKTLTAALAAAALALSCAAPAAADGRITLKAAKSGTSYYVMAVQLAEAAKTAAGIDVTVEESQGSVQNVKEAIRRRSEEHTSELQSLMRISYAVFCLKKKKN